VKQKNPYPPKTQTVVTPFVNKAVANFPANNPSMGITNLVNKHRAEKTARKVDIIAAGCCLADMRKC
jgi:hypothetical protein